MATIREVNIDGKTVQFEFEKYAKQANGSVMVTSGGTQVLVTVCAAKEADPSTDFFPLGVDYIEKFYSIGRIPGGYVKREGKPSDQATLTARVLDRPLRPCFPKGFKNETVITATVMSYEFGFSPATLALIGASTALMISDIPFEGPVAGLRIGMKDGKYIIDPPEDTAEDGELDLNIACKKDAVLMVEAGAQFLSEDQMLEAISFAHEAMKPFFEMQEEIQKAIGKEKWAIEEPKVNTQLQASIEDISKPLLTEAFAIKDKLKRGSALSAVKKEICEKLDAGNANGLHAEIKSIFDHVKSQHMRSMIIKDKVRIDGRSPTDIRPISCETGVLKRAHGSSLFTRGETQALASVTLAAAEDQQKFETLWSSEVKQRFMLHYNFPPFSVGEARMQRSPGRREIGHGTLARRALCPVIPELNDFGYTIRVVSETLESNGSSSMAAVCSGTMAMLNAGVPLTSPVTGIAMGLVKEGEEYTVLSDILGDEDHLGDMDFKVCGNDNGITALQMDIKIGGITMEIMREALLQAKEGRKFIMDKITATISEPSELSEFAPRIFKLKVKQDKVRDLIGPGGKTIKKVTADTGVKMDIEEDGIISIVAPDATAAQAAKSMIRSITTNPQVGDVYLGKAVRLTDFGVFIEIKPGLDGLCHISQLDAERVEKIEDLVKLGDEVMVKIVDIDRQGRIKLSRKDAIGEKPKEI